MCNPLECHRIEIVRSVASEAAGGAAANSPTSAIDLWENNQLPNRVLIVVDVTDVGSGGVLDLIVQDSTDNSTFDADFMTVAQISETGLYFIDVNDPNRYLRLNHDTTTDAVTWGAYMLTFENQRCPVTQSGSSPAITYGTGRVGKVAAS